MYTHGEKGIKDGGKKDLWHSFSTRSPAGKVLSSDAEPGKALWQNHTHTQCGRKSVKAVGPLFSWCDLTEIGLQERKSRTLGLPWLHGWRQCWATPGSFFPQYWFFSLLAAEELVAGGESELPRLPTLTAPWMAPAVSQRPEDGESGPMEESPWRSAAVFTCSGFTPPPLSLLPLSARLPTPAKTTAREREKTSSA